MEVDPVALKAFADQVDSAGMTITEVQLPATVAGACSGLDGSTSAWAAQLVGTHLGTLVEAHTRSVDAMGIAVRGAGDSFVVTDDDLADDFAMLWEK